MNSTWLYIVCKSAIYRSIILLPLQSNDIVLIILIILVIVPYKCREIRLQNFAKYVTQWKILLQDNTKHYS